MTLQEEDLLGRYFRLERADGSTISNLVRLALDRRIIGSTHPNETTWQIKGGLLTFHDPGGVVTTEFFQASRDGDRLVLAGGFVPRDRYEPWHILRELVPMAPVLQSTATGNDRSEETAYGTHGAPTPSVTKEEISRKVFVYKDTVGQVLAPAVYFLPDGRVFGTRQPDDDSWCLIDGRIEVKNVQGDDSRSFHLAETIDGEVCFVSESCGALDGDDRRFLVELPRLAFEPPTVAKRIRQTGDKPAVILVRTHLMNEKVKSLVESLQQTATNYDVALLVDETNGRPPVSHDPIVWHSVEACRQLGLSCASTRPLWWCGDFPLYFAFEQLPEYKYYFMIEYDVHLTTGSGVLFQDLVERLISGQSHLDAIGLRFRREHFRDDHLVTAAFLRYNDVHSFFFPFLALSRAAIGYLYAQRQVEALKQTPADEIIYCESFVPTLLMQAGFRVGDLNEVIPNSYDQSLMILPGRFLGLPVDLAAGFQNHSHMIHPVYGNEEFLIRTLSRFEGRDWIARFLVLLEDPGLACLPEELRQRLRERAVAKL